jgi:hypothetical protein
MTNETYTDSAGKLLKKCSGPCSSFKYLEEFGLQSKTANYRRSCCKDCRKKFEQGYQSVYCKSYYIKHSDKIKKASTNRYKNNKEACKKTQKYYYARHIEEIKKYKKIYNKAHSKEHIKYCIEYNKKRYEKDINYKLSAILRRRIRHAIKYNVRPGSAVKDLGCSVEELKTRLESMFYTHPNTREIMSWNNYGRRWHIDHIIPLAYFNLTNYKQFIIATNYKNLRPMWAEYNISKGDNLPDNYKDVLEQIVATLKC